jgi:ABC-type dipeptide/oligopeptide/nickel transport system permease subunit
MSEQKGSKSWFGPKRFGFGLRPQTWQGWAIVIAVAVIVVVVSRLLR